MSSRVEFPFLSEHDFLEACDKLQQGSTGWTFLSVDDSPTLRFRKVIPLQSSSHDEHHSVSHDGSDSVNQEGTGDHEGGEDHEDEAEHGDEDEAEHGDEDDDDDDALVRREESPSLIVSYDILLSPSYRVPVVYLQAKISHGRLAQLSVEQLCDHIVPKPWRSAVSDTGVYGALSLTDHPMTGLPTYFVHPCRTADAMLASSEGQQISPLDYMMLWFGIIGGSVGLSLPIETALRSSDTG